MDRAAYVATTSAMPATDNARRFAPDNGSDLPRIIPAHRNASHGSSGCVPLTNVSNTKRRGERYWPGAYHPLNSHLVLWRASTAHHWMTAAATAAAVPTTTSQRVANTNSSAPIMNIAP